MAIDRVRTYAASTSRPVSPAAGQPGSTSFADALRGAGEGVRLSSHALKRIDRRDLGLDAARLGRLDSAISQAAAKGSKSSVVVLDDLAVVVDVRDRTVVTAMKRDPGRERVFTNIDSVVIA